MSDIMHVPLLCKYNQESHAVAGALTAVAVSEIGGPDLKLFPRLCVSVAAALVIGTGKEYLIDRNPRPSEIPAWAAGAAVVAFAYEVRW